MSDQVSDMGEEESVISRDQISRLAAIAYEFAGQDSVAAVRLLVYTAAVTFRAGHATKEVQLELFASTIDDIALDAKRFPTFYGDPATRAN